KTHDYSTKDIQDLSQKKCLKRKSNGNINGNTCNTNDNTCNDTNNNTNNGNKTEK
ncbi:3553_t:CDS:1, partial [Dentiscutata erythropus]